MSPNFRIDNVILSGSAVNTKSRLYRRLEAALDKQNGGRGNLRAKLVDENGENGYNYSEDLDGVTGLAGRTKFGMTIRFGWLIGQIIRGLKFGRNKNGKFGIVGLDHPHTNAAEDPNFGDKLIKQALINDVIEGQKGLEGAEEYLKRKQ